MTPPLDHAELEALLGVYALDAVDPDEKRAIEAHLPTCPRCRAEVADLREVAALLANTTAVAPDGVWDRIAAALEATPPPLRLELAPREPEPPITATADATLRPHGRRRSGLLLLAALAAAAAIIVVLSAQVRTLNDKVHTIEQADTADRQNGQLLTAANQAITEPGARVARLTGPAGPSALAVVRADGQGFFVGTNLAAVSPDIYELWGATTDGTIVALQTITGPGVYRFAASPSITTIMVTKELRAVPAPTNAPIVTGTLT